MSGPERRRLMAFSRVKDKQVSVAEAARRLGLSERQGRRLWKRYRLKGDAGLIHGLRGKAGNAGKGALRAQVLVLYRKKYREFGPAHAADMMAQEEKLHVSRKTMWRWLKPEGLVVDPRRVRPHRQRRGRRHCVGELLQMDGSTHSWFGPEYPPCVMFVTVDDASSELFVRCYATEDTTTAFDLFGQYAKGHGLPESLYVDHDSIYVVNEQEVHAHARQRGQKAPVTQFGRAMAELGVGIICANSPQAKGRVERNHGTLQDRLVKELKLAGICTIAAANEFLEKKFIPAYNRSYAKPPASGINVHHPVPKGVKLEDVLCHREERVVGQDWCISYQNRIVQIPKQHEALSLAGRKVDVHERADGTLKLVYQGKSLVWTEIVSRPVPEPKKKPMAMVKAPWRPGPDHPWNRPFITANPTAAEHRLAPPTKNFGGVVKPVPLQSVSLRSPSFRSTGLTTPHPKRTLLLRR